MVVRITLGAPNPEIAFQLQSYVQEHILDYLNQFKKGLLSEPLPIKNLQRKGQNP